MFLTMFVSVNNSLKMCSHTTLRYEKFITIIFYIERYAEVLTEGVLNPRPCRQIRDSNQLSYLCDTTKVTYATLTELSTAHNWGAIYNIFRVV